MVLAAGGGLLDRWGGMVSPDRSHPPVQELVQLVPWRDHLSKIGLRGRAAREPVRDGQCTGLPADFDLSTYIESYDAPTGRLRAARARLVT